MDATSSVPAVIGVDTGGTFTDVFVSDGTVVKLPSTPGNPADAILSAVHSAGARPGDAVSHGTTVATNAVLERKGARTALITTAGFEDVIEIRRQSRPALYDLFARWPDPLVPSGLRFGAAERLDYQGNVIHALEPGVAAGLAERLAGEDVESIAVVLLFAYVDPAHEIALGTVLRARLGAEFPVALSHRIAPRYGEYERTSTTVVNAYVLPIMSRYLESLRSALKDHGIDRLHVMHSNGGLLSARSAAERPVQTVLSGPAAGVVGARVVAGRAGRDQLVTFDMGGTSTDVAVVPGELLAGGDGEVAGFPLLLPMLRIETVGAGGGSIARVDSGGGLHVGPESAGADPGPAAYGVGDMPTVTDANLILGRLSPRGLLGGDVPLDIERARHAMKSVSGLLAMTLEQAAWSVVRLANSNMARAVRTVTLQCGYDPRRLTLFPFGGAGPLHGVELADDLGISEVLVPAHPGVIAALGLTVPDLQRDVYRTVLLPLDADAIPRLETVLAELEHVARASVEEEDLFGPAVVCRSVDVRYSGQSFDLPVPFESCAGTLADSFTAAYTRRYGYVPTGQRIEIVNAAVRLTLPRLMPPQLVPPWPEAGPPPGSRQVWFGSQLGVEDLHSLTVAVYWRPSLATGTTISGPAVLEQYDSTTLVPPGWDATVDQSFNLLLVEGSR